ncbi:MAG: hypothetical protein CBC65_002110 [Rhodothermaceae bacterium TMED105]|nr:MAG: hypothetical protein CBC65_002110 [Rhodothermaceae bacterium TMED105]
MFIEVVKKISYVRYVMDDPCTQFACHIISKHVPTWVDSTHHIVVEKMSGLANTCYRVYKVHDPHESFVYRPRMVRGPHDREGDVFRQMSEEGLGPKLIHQNTEYRIESFVHGRTLELRELRNPEIMNASISAIHRMHLCLTGQGSTAIELAIDVWAPRVKRRLYAIRDNTTSPYIQATANMICDEFLEDGYLKRLLTMVRGFETTVMSHNDVHELNIIYNEENVVTLIDYEHCMPNPQMYDVANYLNEFAVDNRDGSYHPQLKATRRDIETATRCYHELDGGIWSDEDDICRARLNEVKQCMILSHFYWCMWGIDVLIDENDEGAFNWRFCRGRCQAHSECSH